jgi:hypothetical protein
LEEEPDFSNSNNSYKLIGRIYLLIGIALIFILNGLFIHKIIGVYILAYTIVWYFFFMTPSMLILLSGLMIYKHKKYGLLSISVILCAFAIIHSQFLLITYDEDWYYQMLFLCFSLIPGILTITNSYIIFRLFKTTP